MIYSTLRRLLMANQTSKPQDAKQSIRHKAWNPKVRTGCKTCKKRKLKCDEQKPTCRRCAWAKVKCDGYEALPKAWLFEPQAQTSTQTSTSNPLPHLTKDSLATPDSGISSTQAAESEACDGCGYAHPNCICQQVPNDHQSNGKEDVHTLVLSKSTRPSSPYRLMGEQYNIKYFVEVTAAAFARSGISSSFWVLSFPQAAWTERITRDALLSTAINSRHVYNTLLVDKDTELDLQLSPQATNYENRAMRTLVSDPPPIEAILLASQAFWMNAMLFGDWAKSLQHSYHALKLCASVEDRSKHDPIILTYAEGLAQACLRYFRATRGPCSTHIPDFQGTGVDLLACDATCYIPENFPVEMRLADSLWHIRHVPSALKDYQKALNMRRSRHSQHGRIVGLLRKSLIETSMLALHWKDLLRSEFDSDVVRKAKATVPFTNSPFPSVLRDLNDLIEKDQDSKISFVELELRLRVTIPNFSVSTSRDHPKIVADSISRLLKVDQVSPPSPVL